MLPASTKARLTASKRASMRRQVLIELFAAVRRQRVGHDALAVHVLSEEVRQELVRGLLAAGVSDAGARVSSGAMRQAPFVSYATPPTAEPVVIDLT